VHPDSRGARIEDTPQAVRAALVAHGMARAADDQLAGPSRLRR
jgi:hypothetical protein